MERACAHQEKKDRARGKEPGCLKKTTRKLRKSSKNIASAQGMVQALHRGRRVSRDRSEKPAKKIGG